MGSFNGGRIMNKLFKFISVSAFAMSLTLSTWVTTHAAELNVPGFSGSINTTVTSGFSMRTGKLDCRLLEGWSYTPGDGFRNMTGEIATTPAIVAGALTARGITGTDATLLSRSYDSTGEGCGKPTSDTYGNTTDTLFSYGNDNANDGNLNFRQGDIFSATQKLYSEISGTTDYGMNVNLSFVGLVDPALDINAPAFKQLNSTAESDFESKFEILNAYVTNSYDVGDTFVDVQLGRFVTSWGESTFIPVGMNGLVTNALDLPVLQSPSASIKEALMPTEQLTVTTGLADGSTVEAYYQFGHDQIGLGASGSYFGSEVFGAGALSLDASGTYADEFRQPDACPWTMTGSATPGSTGAGVGLGLGCNATNIAAQSRHATNWANHDTTSLVLTGLKAMTATEVTLAGIVGRTHAFTSNQAAGVNARSVNNIASSGANTDNLGGVNATRLGVVLQGYADLSDARRDKGAAVDIFPAATGVFKDPSDSGQYGFRWSKYLDNVGTGLDLGFYFANYHSKVPYIQFKMPNGVFAQDILGAYLLAAGDFAGTLDDAGVMAAGTDAAGTYQLNGTQAIHAAVSNAMFSGAICDAVLGGTLRPNFGYSGSNTRGFIDDIMMQVNFGRVVDTAEAENEVVHDYSLCQALAGPGNAGSAATTAMIGTGSRLFAAVTPLNAMTYQGIFPEDNKILGMSFNTNVNGTTVQGELAIRPDFPLATSGSDQINQIGDKSGANDALNMVAVGGVDAGAAAANLTGQITIVELLTGGGDYFDTLSAFERSTLGNVVDENGGEIADLSAYNAAFYYSKPYIEYDVISGTLGTTTSFTAGHPITQMIGADSSTFLTEFGFVSVPDLDDANKGFVARNGFNEGAGSGTTKCLGAFGNLAPAMIAAGGNAALLAPRMNTLSTAGAALTNIGSGVVDALFGNGGYCEDNPGADDFAATYRLLGTANYSNFNNSAWSLTPTVVVSHDFMGFAPSSIGGFAEDRFTLSLGATMSKGQLSVSANYVDYMDLGGEYVQPMEDRDYLSFSVSQSF
jgi:hypothetical protein